MWAAAGKVNRIVVVTGERSGDILLKYEIFNVCVLAFTTRDHVEHIVSFHLGFNKGNGFLLLCCPQVTTADVRDFLDRGCKNASDPKTKKLGKLWKKLSTYTYNICLPYAWVIIYVFFLVHVLLLSFLYSFSSQMLNI